MSVAQDAATACPDSAGLMDMAAKATGLDDFGDPRLQVPLDALVNSYRRDAWPKMTEGARAYAVSNLVDNLANRLKVVADRKRYPEIAKVEVKSPMIVIGPPRSGSTLLHTLLSLDPEAIATPYWVCLEPSPPPKLGDPRPERLAATEAKLTRFLDLIPVMKIMHSYFVEEGASALGEDGYDIMVMAQTTKGIYYFYALDSYREYLLSADHTAALDFHHGFLQHVGWGAENKHFALKAADHLVWLRELHARYPDAQLLWTHRDLAEQLGSAASVFIASRSLSAPVPDEAKPAMAADAVELERRIYHHGMKVREELGEDRFCDVNYHELMADPVTTIARLYEQFGRQMSPAFAENVQEWVRQNPQTKHGVHKHRAQDFGIDPDAVNRQFRAYTERYGFGFGIRPPLSV
jgi:hypothetical protein